MSFRRRKLPSFIPVIRPTPFVQSNQNITLDLYQLIWLVMNSQITPGNSDDKHIGVRGHCWPGRWALNWQVLKAAVLTVALAYAALS
ncbi:hypothetical protein NUV25_18255 [Burkholderia pseudomultivorans]|uniref:hypothetical protein n=1 Tax=Burkholderia pseudomultivorans TaxID=1207504 RepID=UPI002874E0F1|nr:hypothetical protein [Burkholderia pseudomultivorans]MDS0859651.1 hypothetical protein [Burkholderia pseudomultivorans]